MSFEDRMRDQGIRNLEGPKKKNTEEILTEVPFEAVATPKATKPKKRVSRNYTLRVETMEELKRRAQEKDLPTSRYLDRVLTDYFSKH